MTVFDIASTITILARHIHSISTQKSNIIMYEIDINTIPNKTQLNYLFHYIYSYKSNAKKKKKKF